MTGYRATERMAVGYTDVRALRGSPPSPASYREMIEREPEQTRIDYQVAVSSYYGILVPVMRWPRARSD